jgi:phage terminase large subunit-like protein
LLALGSAEAIRRTLESLPLEDLRRLSNDFWEWSNAAQCPPEGTWKVWLFLGGRGAGKTKAGAEFVASMVVQGHARRIGLISETLGDAQSVMVEGPSGLMHLRARARRPKLVVSGRKVIWPNGAEARWFSAETPDQLRGPEFDLVWADEFAKWSNRAVTLEMARLALRQGAFPRLLVTTTPLNIPELKELENASGVATTRAETCDNRVNLSPGFLTQIYERLGDSALGRQELKGEILEDDPNAIFKRDWIDAARVSAAPELVRVVVGVDPPVTGTARSDGCGIIAAGRGRDGGLYVLGDYSVRGRTMDAWADRVRTAVEDSGATLVVAETNQGGDLVTDAVKRTCPHVGVAKRWAHQGKKKRADAFAFSYQRGEVHHVGLLRELEDEMCLFTGSKRRSPDRMDALIWALRELEPLPEPAMPKVMLLD